MKIDSTLESDISSWIAENVKNSPVSCTVLSKFVIAQLKQNGNISSIIEGCRNRLKTFLKDRTNEMVESLFLHFFYSEMNEDDKV